MEKEKSLLNTASLMCFAMIAILASLEVFIAFVIVNIPSYVESTAAVVTLITILSGLFVASVIMQVILFKMSKEFCKLDL